MRAYQNLADQAVQRQGKPEEVELLQGKFDPIQRMGNLEEDEPVQGKFQPIQRKENNTGLPDQLKFGIESMSGLSMDDVNVHYNSSRPAPLQAHAYTQGTDIHVASRQENTWPMKRGTWYSKNKAG